MSNVDAAVALRKMLGGRGSRNDRVACPVCQSSHCVAVNPGRDGKVVAYCHAHGCDVMGWLHENGWEAKKIRERVPWENPQLEEHERLRRALAILRKAERKPAADYLRSRGIDIVPWSGMLLSRTAAGELGLPLFPAMMFPVIDSKGKLLGAHVTQLNRNGTGKLKSPDSVKRAFGPIRGGYVQLAPRKPDDVLIIGEGIESTLSAMQLSGLPGIATLNATNMQVCEPPRASQYIIAGDNDEAGRKGASVLAERLEYEGYRARIALPARENDDWNDVLAHEDAKQMWDEAVKHEVEREKLEKHHALEEFMNLTFPKREMLMAPWLPQPGIAMIYARAGSAKTYLALSIAFAVARGDDLLSWQCERPGRVLYIDGEMPGRFLQERLGLYGKAPRESIYVVNHDTFNMRRERMPDLGTPEGRRTVDGIIKQVRPDLIIIDSLTTLVRSGEESSKEDWLPVQDWLMKHRWRGRSILILHHAGKSGDQRGTSARKDTPETIIKLTKKTDVEKDEDETVLELEFDKGRELWGKDEEPMLLRLTVKDGRVDWVHDLVRDKRKERIEQMLDEGMSQADIARELNLSKGRISQIVKKLDTQTNVVTFQRKAKVRA